MYQLFPVMHCPCLAGIRGQIYLLVRMGNTRGPFASEVTP